MTSIYDSVYNFIINRYVYVTMCAGPYGAVRDIETWSELSYIHYGNITGFNVTLGNTWLKK
jgi:hypothetical protein